MPPRAHDGVDPRRLLPAQRVANDLRGVVRVVRAARVRARQGRPALGEEVRVALLCLRGLVSLSPDVLLLRAVLLPPQAAGASVLPTYWLSEESVESLRRSCAEDGSGVSLHALRFVVGRVVHLTEPAVATAEHNPYVLPLGEEFVVVHAEMMPSHRLLRAP